MKKNRAISILFGTAVLIFLILIVYSLHEEATLDEYSNLMSLKMIGTYRLSIDGESYPISDDMKIDADRNRILILEGHFNINIEKGHQILMRLAHISVEIYRDDELIYSYGLRKQNIPFSDSGGNGWASYCSNDINASDNIKIILRNPYFMNEEDVYEKFLDELYVGDKMVLARKILHKEGFNYILSCLITLIGILILMDYTYFRKFGIEVERSVCWCAFLIMITGVWAAIDNPVLSLLIPYRATLCIASHFLLYMTAPFEVYYHTFIMSGKRKKIAKTLSLIGIITIIISILLQFTGRCDIMNSFILVKPIALATTLATTICMIFECVREHSTVYRLYLISDLSFSFFCTLGTFSRLVLRESRNYFFYCGFFLFAVVQFISITYRMGEIMKQSKSASELQTELLQNHIAITLSQIQPHFLFNVLTAIQQLCERSPEKARQAIENFSWYLRGNVDSLGSKEKILFRKEMDHVRCYLSLEQMRFNERIRVEYDLQEVDFFIPPLTVQPMVENAVKHGLTKKKEGGCVSISTKRKSDYIEICIQDNGVGFNQEEKKEDGCSHIGIDNVKNRLKKMCNGELEVKSEIGVGTTVIMRIPTE